MKPRNKTYVGGPLLDPPDEPDPVTEDCDACGGWGWIEFDGEHSGCMICEGTGLVVLSDEELRQRAFDDFDPPDADFGD